MKLLSLTNKSAFLRVTLLLIIFAGFLSASALHDNGPPDGSSGLTIGGPFATADDFIIDADATVNHIDFNSFESEAAAPPPAIEYGIYSNAGGAPGALLSGGSAQNMTYIPTGSGVPFPNTNSYHGSFDVTPLLLTPGSYWLSLYSTDRTIAWSETNIFQNNAAVQNLFGGPFSLPATSVSFSVSGDLVAPEPATYAMLGTGLVLLAAVGRKRK